MLSIREHLASSEQAFVESSTPRLDSEVLLAHVLNKPRSWLHAWPEKSLESESAEQFESLVRERQAGKPIAYILGQREFWSLPFIVNEHVLIPRPETELLVEILLSALPKALATTVLELGTGSGAVALSIAKERPFWEITAVDISSEALVIAQQNAEALGIDTVGFIQSDWFSSVPAQKFDVIISNPPYIADDSPYLVEGDVQHEPRKALISGPDGLDDIRKISRDALNYLKPEGLLCLEHGYDQGEVVREILKVAGYCNIRTQKDLQGLDRMTWCIFKDSG